MATAFEECRIHLFVGIRGTVVLRQVCKATRQVVPCPSQEDIAGVEQLDWLIKTCRTLTIGSPIEKLTHGANIKCHCVSRTSPSLPNTYFSCPEHPSTPLLRISHISQAVDPLRRKWRCMACDAIIPVSSDRGKFRAMKLWCEGTAAGVKTSRQGR